MTWNGEATKAWRQAARLRNQEFVASVNSATVCAHCGAQPIEWHNPDHVALKRQKQRIGDMVSRGRQIEAIRAEMSVCTPLCRTCHMREDGRLDQLHAARRQAANERVTPERECAECKRVLRLYARGLCSRCYQRQPDQRSARNRARAYTGDLTSPHACGATEWGVSKSGQRFCRPCQRAASKKSYEKRQAALRAEVEAREPRQLELVS